MPDRAAVRETAGGVQVRLTDNLFLWSVTLKIPPERRVLGVSWAEHSRSRVTCATRSALLCAEAGAWLR